MSPFSPLYFSIIIQINLNSYDSHYFLGMIAISGVVGVALVNERRLICLYFELVVRMLALSPATALIGGRTERHASSRLGQNETFTN